jgi:toxin ParE1/3/4
VQVIFTPLAERHVDSLYQYITRHASEDRADSYVGRIVDFCKGLTAFPMRGHVARRSSARAARDRT